MLKNTIERPIRKTNIGRAIIIVSPKPAKKLPNGASCGGRNNAIIPNANAIMIPLINASIAEIEEDINVKGTIFIEDISFMSTIFLPPFNFLSFHLFVE
ncbi:MAG: hypothetical protein ACXVHW_07070 [Methanobacterium sp.]